MEKIFVTGGAGFIGSHTTRRLLDLGHEVTVLDFFHQYHFPIDRNYLDNVEYRFEHLLTGAKVVRGSTQNKEALRRIVLEAKPDRIIHFAALPLANIALRGTEEAFGSILAGTVNLLEGLREVSSLRVESVSGTESPSSTSRPVM